MFDWTLRKEWQDTMGLFIKMAIGGVVLAVFGVVEGNWGLAGAGAALSFAGFSLWRFFAE